MIEARLTGKCGCGQIQYTLTRGTYDAVYCHCLDCARTTGATPVAWVCIKTDHFELVRGTLKSFHSSQNGRRSFCGDCGCVVLFQDARYPNDLDLTMATLNDPGELKPTCHIWTRSKPAWVPLNDGLKVYEKGRGGIGNSE